MQQSAVVKKSDFVVDRGFHLLEKLSPYVFQKPRLASWLMFGLKQMYVPFLAKGLVFLNIWFLFEIISNLSYGVFNVFVFMKSHFVSVKKIKSRIKILTFSLLVCPLIQWRIQNIRSICLIGSFWRINSRNMFPNAFGPIRVQSVFQL